jgi:hypothetical protein
MSTERELNGQRVIEETVTYTFHQRDQRRRFGSHRCLIEEDDWKIDIL